MPVTDAQFNALRKIVVDQGNLINDLRNKVNELLDCCNCNNVPHYREANVDALDENGHPYWGDYYLNINDRFPLPACVDQKGILITNDATVFCYFASEYDSNDPNSGWQIFAVTKGGKNV